LASLLEDDARFTRSGTETREIDVIVGVVCDLAELVTGGVVRPDVLALVGVVVGEEIDGLASPHGERLGPRPVRHMMQRPTIEIVDIDVLPQPPFVALPGAKV